MNHRLKNVSIFYKYCCKECGTFTETKDLGRLHCINYVPDNKGLDIEMFRCSCGYETHSEYNILSHQEYYCKENRIEVSP